MARLTTDDIDIILNNISDPVLDTDAANKQYVDNHPEVGAIAAYSATETYSQGDYIRYTNNIIYYWNSSTDSTAGTSPDTDGNHWVAIRSGNGIQGANYNFAYEGIKGLAFDMQSWTVVSDIGADDVDDNDVQITIVGDTTILDFHRSEDWWGQNQPNTNGFFQVHNGNNTPGIYPIIAFSEQDENQVILGKVIEGPDRLADANVGDTNLLFYISVGLQTRTAGIHDDAVTQAKIADGAIGNAQMAENSVNSDQYVDSSIDEPHLNISNTPTAGQVLSSDGSDGFTWIDDNNTHGIDFHSGTLISFRGQNISGQNYERVGQPDVDADTKFAVGTNINAPYEIQFHTANTLEFWEDQPVSGSYLRISQGGDSGVYAIQDFILTLNQLWLSNVIDGTDVLANTSDDDTGFAFGMSNATPVGTAAISNNAVQYNKIDVSGIAGQVLKVNSSGDNWEWTNNALNDLSDVTISSPSDNQVLTYDSDNSVWINQNAHATDLSSTTLSDIGNVNAGGHIEGQVLTWNGDSNMWVNRDIPDNSENWLDANNGNDFTTAASATGGNSIAIGDETTATAYGAIAIGTSADATQSESAAIGHQAHADHANSMAIGRRATTDQSEELRLGASSLHVTVADGSAGSESYENEVASKRYVDHQVANAHATIKATNPDRIVTAGTENSIDDFGSYNPARPRKSHAITAGTRDHGYFLPMLSRSDNQNVEAFPSFGDNRWSRVFKPDDDISGGFRLTILSGSDVYQTEFPSETLDTELWRWDGQDGAEIFYGDGDRTFSFLTTWQNTSSTESRTYNPPGHTVQVQLCKWAAGATSINDNLTILATSNKVFQETGEITIAANGTYVPPESNRQSVTVPAISEDNSFTINNGDYIGWRVRLTFNGTFDDQDNFRFAFEDWDTSSENNPQLPWGLSVNHSKDTHQLIIQDTDSDTVSLIVADVDTPANDVTLLNNGLIPTGTLGSGTANNTTVLLGNQTYAQVDTSQLATAAVENDKIDDGAVSVDKLSNNGAPSSAGQFLTNLGDGLTETRFEWVDSPENIYVQTAFTTGAPGEPGVRSIAIGGDSATNTIAAVGDESIVIGSGARATGDNVIVAGADATTGGNNNSFAIGHNATVRVGAASGIAFGANSSAGLTDGNIATHALAFGPDAEARGQSNVSIGGFAFTQGTNSIAIGASSSATNRTEVMSSNSVAIGDQASVVANSAESVAIGFNATAGTTDSGQVGESTIAVGHNSVSSRDSSISIGAHSTASGDNSVAIGGSNASGDGASVTDSHGIAIGYETDVDSSSGIAIGRNAEVTIQADNGIAIGRDAKVRINDLTDTDLESARGIAIGYGSDSQNSSSISVGSFARALADNSIAIGGSSGAANSAETNGARSISIGYNTDVSSDADDSVALGSHVSVTADKAVAIGHGTDSSNKLTNSTANSILLGYTDQTTFLGRATPTGSDSSNDLAVATKAYVDANGVGPNSVDLDNINAGTSVAGQVLQVNSTNDGLVWANEQQIQISELADIGDVTDPGDNLGGRPLVKMAGEGTGWQAQALTSDGFGPGSVIESKIADNAVTENKINAGAVTNAKMADNSVDYAEINATGSAGQVLSVTGSVGNESLQWITPAAGETYISINSTGGTVPDTTNGTDSISIGRDSSAINDFATAVGFNADAESVGSIAIGSGSQAGAASVNTSDSMISIGRNSTAVGDNSIALGPASTASFNESIAIGRGAISNAAGATVIGAGTTNGVSNSVLLGASNQTVRLGRSTLASDSDNQVVTKGFLNTRTNYTRQQTTALSLKSNYVIQNAPSGTFTATTSFDYIIQGQTVSGYLHIDFSDNGIGPWVVGDRFILENLPTGLQPQSIGSGTTFVGIGTGWAYDSFSSGNIGHMSFALINENEIAVQVTSVNGTAQLNDSIRAHLQWTF